MSTPDLDAIQARADAATEGPWMRRSDHAVVQVSHSTGEQLSAVVYGPAYGTDADFIAHARTDVPALLAYARDLEARIGRVVALHQSSGGHNPKCHCGIPAGSGANCIECGDVWPCPTSAALTATEARQ